MYNNYSSSEDLTESQNFEKFMNAKDSDDEEKALHGKKKGQTTGFAGAGGKASNTKTYPTYGAPSYTSSYNQGGGGGYGTSSGYGATTGGAYGTGYGTYGGGGGTTSGYGAGYGGGYGSGTGFGASASGYGGSGYGGGGSGYGGSGYGGSGYGASGYGGGGYGDSNPYAGVDITGYGGGGYSGGGAGTGYKDKDDDDDEYDDEEEEEEEPVEFDLASVKKRKEEQKAKKEAEEKKAEEERKAKEERQAYLASLATKTSTSTTKKEKNAKVTFNLGEAIQDDSDNDNNKNISHISERDDSNVSSDRQATKKKPTTTSNNRNFLNISDDEKKVTEDSDEKIVPESEDNIEDVNETPKKTAYESKKDEKGSEIESSYADDFEASSSKFGSADMGKAALKLNTKKTNEFEDSSHLSESKDARYDDKYTDRIVDTKAETKPAILTDAKTTTYQTKPSEQTQNIGPSSLTQHYETRIAKDYVYESLLKDEKMKIDRLEAQLSLGGDQVRNVQQLIAEKDVTIHKLMTETQKLQKDMDIWQFEAQDYEKKNKIYEIENEDLQKRIEVLEGKLMESESQRRILSKDNEDKTKALKERKTALEEEFKENIIRELKAQQENEKDLLFLKIEDLEDKNKRFEEQNEQLRENSRLYKTNFREKAESDQEVRRLKQEIMVLELKLKDRDQNKSKKPNAAETSTAPTRETLAPIASGVPELDKEIQMQELLIKGFQKENEKLIVENKALKKEIEDLNGRLYDEGKKVTEIKAKLVHNTDNVLITDKEIDIETKKMLGAENLISKDELKVARERIVQLQKDLQGREEVFNQREIEMKFELDRLRAQKMNLEARSGGVDLNNLKQQDESYKQLQGTLENEKQRYEAELRDMRSKLKWYIENQESIAAKEDIIKQKNEAIQKLEEDISKILSDPGTNLDAKSKHFNKVSNEDKKRIKQLEKDVENLEEALKKRNPGVYDKMKAEKDESALVKDLKQTVKRLQDDKTVAEKEYDTKLNDLRQKFDKMKLGYENREPVQVNANQPKNAAANLENVEVLKTRIKELEKEVEDAKKYYLKKAQQLKDNKKGTKSTTLTVEKDLRATKETAKGSTKKVQFNVDSEVSSDKENQDSSNTIYDAERINLLNKLVNLPTTPVYALLNGFETYRTGALTAFKNNNTIQASNIKKEFVKLVSETLGDYPQRDQITQKVKRVDELIVTEHNDPRYTLDQIQYAIYDLVWSEMKKDRSNMTISSSKTTKVNNFFGSGAEDNGDVSGRKLIVLEEALKKKEEELNNAQQKLSVLNSDNARLQKDKSNLELIIQQLPKNPKSLDFATMEKKLEILERNYRENELEMKNAFRKAYGRDPFGSVSEDEINKIKANYENEIAHLRTTIERKNQEISTFRQQMEVILKELDRLRKNRA